REETGPGAHIDARRRLIQQKHPRTVQQGHRRVQSPFLATRKVTRQAWEKLGELENLGDLLDALVSQRISVARKIGEQDEVVPDRDRRIDPRLLRGETDLGAGGATT